MWVSLGLKLLGIGDFLKEFFKNNWKWFVPTVALVVSFFIVSHIYYNKGIEAERAVWQSRIKQEDEYNRLFDKKLNVAISTFGKDAVEKALARVEKETVYRDRVQTLVKNNPIYSSCLIDQEVIDSRNAIRAQGPKPAYPIRIELDGGSE